MKKKLLIDGYFYGTNGGIGNYLDRLINIINSKIYDEYSIYIIIPKKINEIDIKKYNKIKFIYFPKIIGIWELIFIPILNIYYKFDCILSPSNISPYFIDKSKHVLIIHDVIFSLPEKVLQKSSNLYQRLGRNYLYFNTKLLAKRASKIVAISNNTKEDLVKYYAIEENKISVIYGAAGQKFAECNSNIEERTIYIHFFSTDPRKNSQLVIDAFIKSNLYTKGYKLYLIGKGSQRHKNLNPKGIFTFNFLSIDEINNLIPNVRVLLYPSLYEGFGLPIIEFNNSNIPVITSKTTSCFEVATDLNYLIDPVSVCELIRALKYFSNNENLNYYSIRVKKNADRFSWDNYTLKLRELLNEI
jgi:glycosyltransferase involved in cell wall biosynthesis